MDTPTILNLLALGVVGVLNLVIGRQRLARTRREIAALAAEHPGLFLRPRWVIPSDAPQGNGREVVAREAGPAIICERLPRPEWMERRC